MLFFIIIFILYAQESESLISKFYCASMVMRTINVWSKYVARLWKPTEGKNESCALAMLGGQRASPTVLSVWTNLGPLLSYFSTVQLALGTQKFLYRILCVWPQPRLSTWLASCPGGHFCSLSVWVARIRGACVFSTDQSEWTLWSSVGASAQCNLLTSA